MFDAHNFTYKEFLAEVIGGRVIIFQNNSDHGWIKSCLAVDEMLAEIVVGKSFSEQTIPLPLGAYRISLSTGMMTLTGSVFIDHIHISYKECNSTGNF